MERTDGLVGVLIVDDHPVTRIGIAWIVTNGGMEVLGQAGTGGEAIAMHKRLLPTVTLNGSAVAGYERCRSNPADSCEHAKSEDCCTYDVRRGCKTFCRRLTLEPAGILSRECRTMFYSRRCTRRIAVHDFYRMRLWKLYSRGGLVSI